MDELGFLPVRLRRLGSELTRSIRNLQIGLEFGGKINRLTLGFSPNVNGFGTRVK